MRERRSWSKEVKQTNLDGEASEATGGRNAVAQLHAALLER